MLDRYYRNIQVLPNCSDGCTTRTHPRPSTSLAGQLQIFRKIEAQHLVKAAVPARQGHSGSLTSSMVVK